MLKHALSSVCRHALVPTLLVFFAACSDGGKGDPPPMEVQPVTRVRITAPRDSVILGAETPLTLEARDANNATVSVTPAWSSLDGSRATLTGSSLRAAAADGSVRLVAIARGLADTVTLRVVVPADLVLTVTAPDSLTDNIASTGLTVSGSRGGTSIGPLLGAWSTTGAARLTSDSARATSVTAQGVGVGSAVISVRIGSASASRSVTVVPTPLATLALTVGRSRVLRDDSTTTVTTATDITGRPVPLDALQASVVPAGAAQLRGGYLIGRDTGVVTLRVQRGARSTTTTLGVLPAPALTLTLGQGVGPSLPARVAALFPAVIARWREIIVEDFGTASATIQTTGDCGLAAGTTITTRGVHIAVALDSLDGRAGGTVARGGPCLLRSSRAVPLVGVITLDTADVASLSDATLANVLTHEIAHVFGIGTLWAPTYGLFSPPLVQGSMTDPAALFLGTRAQAAYGQLRGLGATAVPLQVGWAHWSPSALPGELLSPTVGATPNQPLSSVTVAALADLGYLVASGGRDPYTLPTIQSSGISGRIVNDGHTASVDDRFLPGTHTGRVRIPSRP